MEVSFRVVPKESMEIWEKKHAELKGSFEPIT